MSTLALPILAQGHTTNLLKHTKRPYKLIRNSERPITTSALPTRQMGDIDKAIEMEKKSLEVDPTSYMSYYSLGMIYFENARYEESEEAFQRFLKIYPYIPQVHGFLAIVCAAQKKFDKAVTELEWEIRINPYDPLVHLNLGRIYWYEFQNRQKAIYHLKVALMLDPFLPNRGEIRRLVRQLEGLP